MNYYNKKFFKGEKAFTDSLEKIGDAEEKTFRDVKSIIKLLKENLSLRKK